MNRNRIPLTIALLALALLLLSFFGINFFAAPIWLVFRRATGLETAKIVAQIAAWLATIGLMVVGAVIAIPTAFVPANRLRKLAYVLPVYLLGLMVATGLANVLGIATVGSIIGGQGPFRLSLAIAAFSLCAVLATIALVITVARANLSERVLKIATTITGIAIVPSVILCLAMLASINIVMANQASLPAGGEPPGGGVPPASTPPVPPGGPGGFGGIVNLVTQFEIGGGAMIVLGIIALVSIVVALRASRTANQAAVTAPLNYRREAIQALISAIVISAIAFVAMQLVPISRTNPPVQSAISWDSPQTKDLAYRTCMNCHSNETAWPWYALFAPGSWITSVHVNSAREQFNLSELNKMPAFRRSRLARDMADQIRNNTMPPIDFLLLHPEANLTDAEKNQLIQGLQNSIK